MADQDVSRWLLISLATSNCCVCPYCKFVLSRVVGRCRDFLCLSLPSPLIRRVFARGQWSVGSLKRICWHHYQITKALPLPLGTDLIPPLPRITHRLWRSISVFWKVAEQSWCYLRGWYVPPPLTLKGVWDGSHKRPRFASGTAGASGWSLGLEHLLIPGECCREFPVVLQQSPTGSHSVVCTSAGVRTRSILLSPL